MGENWKILAEKYDDENWSFSSAKAWEKVVKENPKPFNKIQYVDQLRLSGNYLKAKEVISKIKDCLNIDPNFPNAKKWLEDFENMEKKLIEK